ALGRWTSADPLAVHSLGAADLNLYAYVHGRVLAATDPLGLDEKNARTKRRGERQELAQGKAAQGPIQAEILATHPGPIYRCYFGQRVSTIVAAEGGSLTPEQLAAFGGDMPDVVIVEVAHGRMWVG